MHNGRYVGLHKWQSQSSSDISTDLKRGLEPLMVSNVGTRGWKFRRIKVSRNFDIWIGYVIFQENVKDIYIRVRPQEVAAFIKSIGTNMYKCCPMLQTFNLAMH